MARKSDDQLICLVDSLPVGMLITNLEGEVLEANRYMMQWSGYDSKNELLSTPVWNLYSEAGDRDRLLASLMSGGPVTDLEIRGRKKDGSTPWVSISSVQIDRDGGQLIVSAITDVSDRKMAEEELRRSEERLQMITDTAKDAIIMIDQGGRITFWNPAAEDIFGWAAEEVIGKDLHALVVPERHLEPYRAGFREFRITGRGHMVDRTVELEGLRKDGTEFPLELSLSVAHGERAWQGVGVIRDITKRKEAEAELERTNSRLEEFAHTVSHDMKAPLNSILLGSEFLASCIRRANLPDESAAEAEHIVEAMGRDVRRSSRLINGLLALAEAGNASEETFPVEVREEVENVLEDAAGRIKEKGIRVEVDDDLGIVTASPVHVYELFSNLINNALEHCDSNEPLVEIKCLAGEGEGNRFLVRDNGSGIPVENIEKIFMPFFKGENGGTGIGLSIVERIIDTYGGEIRVYNDNGACFEFVLRDPHVEASGRRRDGAGNDTPIDTGN